ADFLTIHFKTGHFEPDNNLALDREAMKNMRIHSDAELEVFISGYEAFLIDQSEALRYLN
ncbi:MAG: hypothetical protein WC557_09480, partial [Ignavibacteriaceae bacterium]